VYEGSGLGVANADRTLIVLPQRVVQLLAAAIMIEKPVDRAEISFDDIGMPQLEKKCCAEVYQPKQKNEVFLVNRLHRIEGVGFKVSMTIVMCVITRKIVPRVPLLSQHFVKTRQGIHCFSGQVNLLSSIKQPQGGAYAF
jgi:hypothetical protein